MTIDNIKSSNNRLKRQLIANNSIFRTTFVKDEDIEKEIRENTVLRWSIGKGHDESRKASELIVGAMYSSVLESIENKLYANNVSYEVIDRIEKTKEIIENFLENSTRTIIVRNKGKYESHDIESIHELSTFANFSIRSVVATLTLYLTGVASTFLSAVTLSTVPLGLLVGFTLLAPRTQLRKARHDIDNFMRNAGKFVSTMLMLPDIDKDKNIINLLDDLEISPEIKRKFHGDDTFDVMAGMGNYCSQKVKTLSSQEIGREVNPRDMNKISAIIQDISVAFSRTATPSKYLFEYRKCMIERLIDLYKIIFIGIFVKYMEYNQTKKIITSSYSTKLLFTYFQNISKVEPTFRKRFESLIKLRNLIDTYPELIEKSDDMEEVYKTELIEFIKNSLKSSDKDLDQAIRNNIDRFEYEQAKKAFINTTDEMKVLDSFLDPIKRIKEKEKKEKEKKEKEKKEKDKRDYI